MKKAATRIACAALALLLATGFAPGPDMSEAEVREKASSVPRLQELSPTVETSVGYEDATDAWRVILTEGAAEDPIAYLTVADDSGEVEGLNVLSNAAELDYPSLTEDEAVKLALADERVQAELSEHGPYSQNVDYEDGEWTVRFFVEEEGPWAAGRRTRARRSPSPG